jgi:hypothetical protein
MSAAKSGAGRASKNPGCRYAHPGYELTALGQDVQITVKPTRKARGEMAVVVR